MKASESVVDRQTVQRLLFARLLVQTKRALTRDQVVKKVAQALSPLVSRPAAERAAREELARNEASGWIADVAPRAAPADNRAAKRGSRSPATRGTSARKAASRLTLTSEAQALAPALFGSEAMPVIRSWDHGQQLAALSRIGRAAAAEKTLHVDDLSAVILAERRGAPQELATLRAVVDYLSWRELGVETTAAFEIDAVQRYLLRAIVPHDVRVHPTTWRRMLAMRVVGAERPDAHALVRALFALKPKSRSGATGTQPSRATGGRTPRAAKAGRPTRATKSEPARTTNGARAAKPIGTREATRPVANDNAPVTRAQPTLADFAGAVREAARMPDVTRFHDDRAFIGSVWEQMRARGLLGSMSLDEFKARLIAAHRDGLLRITRADLVAAMDPNELERSEARYQNATFHFVALEAGGSR